jgi:hypothetical protein
VTAPITTLTDLRNHLQIAIGLELTTIPTYLYALYSIEEGANTAAVELIESVVLEEMLHMALAANVLNAIGGRPSTRPIAKLGYSPVPTYPATVPLIPAIPRIHLAPFTPKAVDLFLDIERPVPRKAPRAGAKPTVGYGSIGEFYDAIRDAIERLAKPAVFARGAERRAGCQLTSDQYYGGAGKLVAVTDLEAAREALDTIVREGEGLPERALSAPPSAPATADKEASVLGFEVDDFDVLPYGWRMYSHYARFRELRTGRRYRPGQLVSQQPKGDLVLVDWASVLPAGVDPTAAGCEGTAVHTAMVEANRTYRAIVDAVYASFDGRPEALGEAVHLMFALKYQAIALMRTPSPSDPATHLGPGFEYHQPAGPAVRRGRGGG